MFDEAVEWGRRHHDKLFFFTIVLIGAVSIIVVDHFDASKWLAVGVCAALMVTYAAMALILPGMKLRPDQSGDNLYYQGLLFTLTSLGVALYRFTGTGATDSILRNFGIAIFTTIVGLSLRVLVGQFREDPEDLEHEARTALTQSVKRMRAELDVSVAELRSFATGMKQVVNEFTTSANASTNQALEKSVARFEKASAAMGARLEATATSFQDRSAAFEQALGASVGALESLSERVGRIRADESMVETALLPALEAIRQAAQDFGASLDEQRQAFDEGARSVRTLADSGAQLAQISSTLEQSVERFKSAASALDSAAGYAERFDTASAAAASSTESLSARLQEITSNASSESGAALKAVQAAALEGAQANSMQMQRQLAALEEATSKLVQTLGGLDREFSGSSETIGHVRRELTELAGWIIARLERA